MRWSLSIQYWNYGITTFFSSCYFLCTPGNHTAYVYFFQFTDLLIIGFGKVQIFFSNMFQHTGFFFLLWLELVLFFFCSRKKKWFSCHLQSFCARPGCQVCWWCITLTDKLFRFALHFTDANSISNVNLCKFIRVSELYQVCRKLTNYFSRLWWKPLMEPYII